MTSGVNILGLVIALIILALIIVAPILLVVFIAKRFKNTLSRIIFILWVIATPFALLFFTGYIGSSALRIEKEHCMSVPPSASHIHCEPFFAISIFLDGGGEASFEMSRNDLPIFLSQLKLLKTMSRPDDPSDTPFQHDVPGHFGRVITTFDGISPDGNVMHIDVYDIDPFRVGVWIGTISN